MTTKGNKATVAIVARRQREYEQRSDRILENLERRISESRGRLNEHEQRLDLTDDDRAAAEDDRGRIDALDQAAAEDRRHVADLEDRIAILEAPWWRRRRVRREALERQITRQRERADAARREVEAARRERLAVVGTIDPAIGAVEN